jgi:MoaA/NifB/PqqE/SkfB family radical SAM enzyme
VRSVQISLDGDTQAVYARQRPGGIAAKGARRLPHRLRGRTCRSRSPSHRPASTFTKHRAVIERAVSLGAFRFNTGRLMRMGTAARHWQKLAPSPEQYRRFRDTLQARQRASLNAGMELCYTPFSIYGCAARQPR